MTPTPCYFSHLFGKIYVTKKVPRTVHAAGERVNLDRRSTMDNLTPVSVSPQEEIWKPVLGYEGIYEVSNLGRVKRIGTGRILRKCTSGKYPFVILTYNSLSANFRLHRLVAEAFLGARPTGMQINHIDGNKQNPCLENLEYVTPSQNVCHSISTGLYKHGTPIEIQLAVREMFQCEKPRYYMTEIAQKFGISVDNVKTIVDGNSILLKSRGLGSKAKRAKDKPKIDEQTREEILSLLATNQYQQVEIARMYGVAESTVSRIKYGKYPLKVLNTHNGGVK